ncbi:DUF4065 domain-containing protein [candidate division WOR-3 bacterium]|nr:DUF4065 domain-containing protein [candidate division WOR-3 bacterium]
MVNIGKRIQQLRRQLGYTQQKLADLLGVSRPTISQMEVGTRRICAEELKILADLFNMSIDTLLNPEKEPVVMMRETAVRYKAKPKVRINIPQKNLAKFKEVFLYIISKIGSKPNIGETTLYKILYFVDFNFYEKHEEQLIGATYRKNRYGPTPIEFRKVINEMIRQKVIIKVSSKYFEYPQTKYLPLRKPDLSILGANEIALIDDVLNRLSDMNANQISDYSHNDVPWLTTEDGEIIEYESVFYRTTPYSMREYCEKIQRD